MRLFYFILTICLATLYYGSTIGIAAYFLTKNKKYAQEQAKEFERSIDKMIIVITAVTLFFAVLLYVFDVIVTKEAMVELSVVGSVLSLVVALLWTVVAFLFDFFYLGKYYHKKFGKASGANDRKPFHSAAKLLYVAAWFDFLMNLFIAALISYLR